jgi:hypothetical protein
VPTNRTPRSRSHSGITPRAVELFKTVLAFEEAGGDIWGPACRETREALWTELDLNPWDRGPLAARGTAPDDVIKDSSKRADWERAVKLLRKLEQAAAESG